MLRAARSQSLSVFTTSAGDLKPSGNSTVMGPAASRTTCQLLITRPNWPRVSISVPVPNETPSFSGTITRATAGRAEGEGDETRVAGGQWPVASEDGADWPLATGNWLPPAERGGT